MSAHGSGGFAGCTGLRGADALVDRECLQQMRGSLAGVALLEEAVADSFQRPCFLRGRGDAAGDAQRPGMLVTGLAGGRRAERELAEAVQRLGLADQVAEVFEQRQGLLVAGGGQVVPGLLLDEAEVVERVGLAEQIAQGKTAREARRCLKRRLADHIWRTMIADERSRSAASPGGYPGATLQSSAAGSTPTTSSSDKSLPGPARHDSTTPSPAT
jgi:hypothetical protein